MNYNNDYDAAKTLEDKGKLSSSNYFKQSVLLCRLWLQRGVDESEIYVRLRPVLNSVCIDYTDKMIDAVVHDAIDIAKISPPLTRFQISFTKAEFDFIHNINDANMERIFFAFVCFRKMSETDLFEITKNGLKSLASANWNQRTLNETIQKLVQAGYISCKVRKSTLYYSLCEEFASRADSEVVFASATKKNIYYHYLKYIGIGNYFYCKQCGCIEKRKGQHQTLCVDCAKKVDMANHRKRQMKYTSKLNNKKK